MILLKTRKKTEPADSSRRSDRDVGLAEDSCLEPPVHSEFPTVMEIVGYWMILVSFYLIFRCLWNSMSWFWELDAARYAFRHCVQLRSLQRSTKAPTIQLLCALLGWSLKFQFGPKSSESTKITLISNWYWKCDICVVDHSGGKNTRNKHHKVYTINIDKLYIYIQLEIPNVTPFVEIAW